MIKRLSVDRADDKVKEFLKKLKTEKNQYILEIGGKPLIGVVPPWQVTEIKQQKEDLLSMLREVWAKTEAIPGKKIEKEVEESVKTVRRA